ncbi:MAG: hypothetical protein IPG91_04540 [Ideonella sp.]|nr:hypothetical protein [Ideonella sp.]
MAQMPKTPTRPKKLVWRISADAPKGEWVDPDQIEPAPPKLAEPEVSTGSWVTSSFDLLSGADVIESSGTLTPGMFDELFETQAHDPKRQRK